jgi:hypothetical protein
MYVENTLAYYDTATTISVKVVLASSLSSLLMPLQNKLACLYLKSFSEGLRN